MPLTWLVVMAHWEWPWFTMTLMSQGRSLFIHREGKFVDFIIFTISALKAISLLWWRYIPSAVHFENLWLSALLINIVVVIVDWNVELRVKCDALSVDRLLLWTDWGQNAKIEQSYLDGTHRHVIVNTDLGLWLAGVSVCQLYHHHHHHHHHKCLVPGLQQTGSAWQYKSQYN